MEFIRVAEMLTVMEMRGEDELPIPWSGRCITLNKKKQTGGKRITFKDVVLVGGANSNSTQRNPNHYQNFTRNCRCIHNSEVREFHPPLMEEFNGMRVVL